MPASTPNQSVDAGELGRAISAAVDDGIAPNVERWLAFRGLADGEYVELQALNVTDRGGNKRFAETKFAHVADAATASKLLQEADAWRAPGVYQIANRVDPAVATRCGPNKWHVANKGESTTDKEILARTVVFIDVDAERVKGTSATEEQLAEVHTTACAVFNDLAIHLPAGPSSLAIGHSGNGRAIFIALDAIQESDELDATVKGLLAAIRFRHETAAVKIDPSVSDAKRLVPAWGTVKRKGASNIVDRPHRRTGIVVPQREVRRVSSSDLGSLLSSFRSGLTAAQLADVDRAMGRRATASAAKRASPAGAPASAEPNPFHIANRDIPIADVVDWLGLSDGGDVRCPGCGISGDSSVAIVENGIKCQHKRCAEKGVPGREGFRTIVDVVCEVRGLEAGEALRAIRAQFPSVFPEEKGRVYPFRPPVRPKAQRPPPSTDPHAPFAIDTLVARLGALPKEERDATALDPEVVYAAAEFGEFSPDLAKLRNQLKGLGVLLSTWEKAVRAARREMERERESAPPPAPSPPTSAPAASASSPSVAPSADPEAWRAELNRARTGEVKNTYGNLVLILRNTYGVRLAYNEMRLTPELDGRPLGDEDVGKFREWIERDWRLAPSAQNVIQAVRQIGTEKRYHPVRQYLESLEWDKEPRIFRVAADILGTAATALNQRMIQAFFVASIARVFKPGCKCDTALVLVGDQGYFKSTFFSILGGKWFSDTKMNLNNKDGLLQLAAAWIYEWAEIESITKGHAASDVKAFMASAADNFRPPFAAANITHPRSTVIVGSTNTIQYLNDPTGSRRFHTIPITKMVNLDLLSQWRDQLWAEAKESYLGGCTWWLEREDDEARESAAADYQVEDAIDLVIAKWVWSPAGRQQWVERGFFTTADVIGGALKLDPGKWEKRHEVQVGNALTRLEKWAKGGWQRPRHTVNGVRVRGYTPPKEPPDGLEVGFGEDGAN